MKTLTRIIQFLLNEIVEIFNSIWLMIMAIGFYIALPIYALGAFLLVIFSGKWDGVIYTLILVLATFGIFLIAQFIPTILNLIMGTILNERKENKKIYEEYEQWYENVKYQEFERRKKAQEEYQRQKYEEQRFWEEQYRKQQYQEYSRQRYSEQEESRQKYEKQNNNSHFNYQYTNDGGIIQKFEEYLSIFGIDKNGEINDGIIKKAYRKKMKEVHPDKNTGNTTEQAQKINEINEFLKEQLEYYLMKRGERK